MSESRSEHFLSCDWGTTHFRLRLVRQAPFATVAEFCSSDGVRSLSCQEPGEIRSGCFARVLTHAVQQMATSTPLDITALPICISGMASSSIGWHELPYAPLPFPLDGSAMLFHPLRFPGGQDVYLFSGVAAPDDVMRGEETELLGLAASLLACATPAGVLVILPGTHAKHVWIRDGALNGFSTYMTGECFELFRTASVLRNSVAEESSAIDQDSFREGFLQAQQLSPTAVAFKVRTRQLLQQASAQSGRAFLTGALIGAELRDVAALYPADLPVVLAANAQLQPWYVLGLTLAGMVSRLTVVPAEEVTLAAARGQAAWLKHRHQVENGL